MIDGISYVIATQERDRRRPSPSSRIPSQAPVADKALQAHARRCTRSRVLQRQRHRRPRHDRGEPAGGAGLPCRGRRRRPRVPGHRHDRVRAQRPGGPGARPSATMFSPSEVRLVDRAPGVADGIERLRHVVVRRHADRARRTAQQPQQTLEKNQRYDAAVVAGSAPARRRCTSRCPRRGRRASPTTSSARTASRTTRARRSAAAVAVARTPLGGYWSIQAMRWTGSAGHRRTPAARRRSRVRSTCSSTRVDHLHMVAWKRNGTLYWVLNTLDNELSNDAHAGPRDVLQAREVKLLRAVLARLDPWAALLLGVLVALGVVILLATPGPGTGSSARRRPWSWRRRPRPTSPCSCSPAPAAPAGGGLAARRPRASRRSRRSSSRPQTQGSVAGGGFMPLTRIVDEAGPGGRRHGARAGARRPHGRLAHARRGRRCAWRCRRRTRRPASARPAAAVPGAARRPGTGRGGPAAAWACSTQALAQTLRACRASRTSIVAFANYVLGFGLMQQRPRPAGGHVAGHHVQGAAAVAGRRARVAGARRDVPRRRGLARRPQAAAAPAPGARLPAGSAEPPRPLRHARPRTGPGARGAAGPATAATPYVDEVRRRLRRPPAPRSPCRPITADRLVAAGRGATLAAARVVALRSRCSSPRRAAVAGASAAEAVAALRVLGVSAARQRQPAVVSAPLPAETHGDGRARRGRRSAVLARRGAGRGLPVSPLAGVAGDAPSGGVGLPHRPRRQADAPRGARQRGDAGARLLARDAGAAPGVHAPRLLVRGPAAHARWRVLGADAADAPPARGAAADVGLPGDARCRRRLDAGTLAGAVVLLPAGDAPRRAGAGRRPGLPAAAVVRGRGAPGAAHAASSAETTKRPPAGRALRRASCC